MEMLMNENYAYSAVFYVHKCAEITFASRTGQFCPVKATVVLEIVVSEACAVIDQCLFLVETVPPSVKISVIFVIRNITSNDVPHRTEVTYSCQETKFMKM
ncbi:hypothetical protein T10_3526 [Trichinella papuae]|uniref:Uncharacterized protein n=1 Tax=Trichinella papuae TaxID=268474 RepID=A0A0V1M1B5_9BILA|nr:hypothetical protein T10_12955 [Trichinella papuae]KRZ65434.1 hypothetical protein T10_3526 [Trichinella papuae]